MNIVRCVRLVLRTSMAERFNIMNRRLHNHRKTVIRRSAVTLNCQVLDSTLRSAFHIQQSVIQTNEQCPYKYSPVSFSVDIWIRSSEI